MNENDNIKNNSNDAERNNTNVLRSPIDFEVINSSSALQQERNESNNVVFNNQQKSIRQGNINEQEQSKINQNFSQVQRSSDQINKKVDNGNDKKKKKKFPLILIVLLVIIIFIGVGVYYFINSSRNVFMVAIDTVFGYLEENTINNSTSSGTFSIKMSASGTDSSASYLSSFIDKVDFSGTYGIDYENKLVNVDLKSNYDDKKLINANVYMESGNGYILLDELYDKYIRVPIEDYDSMFSSYSNKDDYRVVVSSIKNAIKVSLKDEYFTKEKVELDGQKVNKTVLKVNKANYDAIMDDIYNELVNDDKFLNSMAIVGRMSVNEVKEILKDLSETDLEFEELEGSNEKFVEFDVALFTKGSDFLKVEFTTSSSKIVISNDDANYNFEFSENNDIVFKGSIVLNKANNNVLLRIDSVESNISIEFNVNSTIEHGSMIEKKVVSNNVSSSEISEDEIKEIYTKLLKEEGVVSLIQDIYSIGFLTSNFVGNDLNQIA